MRQEMPEMSVTRNVCFRNAGCVCVIRNPGCVCVCVIQNVGCVIRNDTKPWVRVCVIRNVCSYSFICHCDGGLLPRWFHYLSHPGARCVHFNIRLLPSAHVPNLCACVCVCFNIRLLSSACVPNPNISGKCVPNPNISCVPNPNISGKLNMTGWQWVKITPGRKLAPNHRKIKICQANDTEHW